MQDIDPKNFTQVSQYMRAKLLPMLKEEAVKGRWERITSDYFRYCIDEMSQCEMLGLVYHVEDVWDIRIECFHVYSDDGLLLGFRYYPCIYEKLSPNINSKLNTLNAQFISTLPFEKEYTCADSNMGGQYIEIEIHRDRDIFQTLCDLFDEILPSFIRFDFQMPTPFVEMTGEMMVLKNYLEDKYGTAFQLVAEEEIINQKLRTGHFLTFNK